jgi:ribonuclease HI
MKTLGPKQTAYDAEVGAIREALTWYQDSQYKHIVVHSDSTSAITRTDHSAAGPGQEQAKKVQKAVARMVLREGRTAQVLWVKGHSGTPGNERADALAGRAAEKATWSKTTSIAHLRLQVSEKYRTAKKTWNDEPSNHGQGAIPPPPPKKSCMDKARNCIARTATQIRTGHWRSAVFLKRIKRRKDDNCWFCGGRAKMTRSHALLHCPNATLAAARVEAWEGRNPGGIRVLLSNPRWERRLLRFLELSGVGRVVEEGLDEDEAYAAKMDGWIAWEEEGARRSPDL